MFALVVQFRCKITQFIYDEIIIAFFLRNLTQELMRLSTFILF
jgi:hypothetical protein